MKATLVSTINPTSILVNVTGKQGIKVKKFMANEIVTATEPFVPFRDGYLKNSATIALDGNFIQYNMPYASVYGMEMALISMVHLIGVVVGLNAHGQ